MSNSSQDSPPLAAQTMPFHEIPTYGARCTTHARRQEWQSWLPPVQVKEEAVRGKESTREGLKAEYRALAKGQFKIGGAAAGHSKTRDELAQDVQWLNEELNSPLPAAPATADSEEEKTSEPQNESASETRHGGAHHGDGGDAGINLPVPAHEAINLTLTDEEEDALTGEEEDDEKRAVVIGDAGWPREVTRIEHMENPLGYAITDLGSVD